MWFAGDFAPGQDSITMTNCNVTANNAQYGGAFYAAPGAIMQVIFCVDVIALFQSY